MTNLGISLECIGRGWHVFPCKAKTKEPAIRGGVLNATNDEVQVRAWWERWPDANPAIATGPSRLCVLDCDHGLTDEGGFRAWVAHHGLPETYTVRTGRRDDFGVQLYFDGDGVKSIGWAEDGLEGDIRCSTGYVMAAGCTHPNGETYEALVEAPVASMPHYMTTLKSVARSGNTGGTNATVVDDGGPITEHRNVRMISLLGRKRREGADDEALRAFALETNESRVNPPLGEDEMERLISNACKFPVPEPEPQVLIGKPDAVTPVDWRTRYLTFEQVHDARPTEFLIEGFLALGSITALAAPVAQRKSLIALNVAHALCTGEPLFGYFALKQRPERVIYLCPEMGLASFSTRVKAIGLAAYIGDTLFCQTMDEDRLALSELNDELPGAVVIIDTLTRFVDGDQNSSEDMSKFADVIFRLKRLGATVLLLHHSIKGASGGLTLDSAMRGSTELAAFVTSCWATRLKDPDDPYRSASILVNVKQRDFESKPFEVVCDETCRMRIVGEPGQMADIKSREDAQAQTALSVILKDSPTMGINSLQKALKAAGHKKGVTWVTKTRGALLGTGVTLAA